MTLSRIWILLRQENELFEKSEIAKRRYDAIKETEERLNQVSEELLKKENEERKLKRFNFMLISSSNV